MSRVTKQTPKHKSTISYHYHRVMPDRRHHRIMIWGIFLLIVVVTTVQMGYPQDRMLPFAKLSGEAVGWRMHEDMTAQITKTFESAKMRLDADGQKSADYKLSITGAMVDADAMVFTLEEYSFWQRFIPFSILWQRPEVTQYVLDYAPSQLREFSEARSRELSVEPTNASLEIRDGKLIAAGDKTGRQVTVAAIRQAIEHTAVHYGSPIVVAVPAERIPAEKQAADFATIKMQAEAALSRRITLVISDSTVTVPADQIATWLMLAARDDGQTVLAVDDDKVAAYLKTLNETIGTPAGRTNVVLENGREVSREVGQTGMRVDHAALGQLIAPYLLQGTGRGVFYGELVPVPPTVVYNCTYTATQEGLQAYINDQAKRGAWFSIRQIRDNGWTADADATESIPSASTYKLFVAKMLFDKMDDGVIKWSDPILDTTVNGCFDRMTIASTNPCAQEWLRQFGRENVNNYMYSLGFSKGTTFTHPEAVHTTAGDLTRMMVGIENGSLLSGNNRDRLFKSLSTHPYRYGIPTGSKGRVYDKVGFLWDYVHDTAIVYHPRGTYVMTIMTKGQSYAAIAKMTRQIEALMYP